jgi:tetrahydrodipicolinate N-succinyltransferase
MSGVTIGENCILGQNVMVGSDVVIGSKFNLAIKSDDIAKQISPRPYFAIKLMASGVTFSAAMVGSLIDKWGYNLAFLIIAGIVFLVTSILFKAIRE